IRAPVVEDAKNAGQGQAAPLGFVDEARGLVDLMVADDLGQKELRMEVGRQQILYLSRGIGVRVGPSAEGPRSIALPQQLAQLPRVLDRSRCADALVAAEDDEGRKSVVVGALGVRHAVL